MASREEICRDGKRYRTLSQSLRAQGRPRIVKIPLLSGCTCPNRSGAKGVGGCTFCTEKGGGEFTNDLPSLSEQYEAGCRTLLSKWRDAAKIAYFQSFTNTFCPPERLRALLEEAMALPDVQGIRIATRGDCLPPEIVAVLAETAGRIPLGVELGLQTANDETARRVNRGHTTAEFCEGYARLQAANIPVCVHLIDGLPGETADDMLASARLLGGLRPAGVKIHALHILRGSALGDAYQQSPWRLLTQEEYVDVVCRQLEVLSPDTVIERLTGDGDRRTLLAPDWTRNKRAVLNAIDGRLARLDTWQSRLWEEHT